MRVARPKHTHTHTHLPTKTNAGPLCTPSCAQVESLAGNKLRMEDTKKNTHTAFKIGTANKKSSAHTQTHSH